MRKASTWHESGTHVEPRPAPQPTREQVLAHTCPRCLAGRGQACRNQDGRPTRPHAARVAVAASQAARTGTSRKIPEPVAIERVRPRPAQDKWAETARRRDETELRQRGMRAISAFSALAPPPKRNAAHPALTVDCPTCRAKEGERCVAPDGIRHGAPHIPRRNLAATTAGPPGPRESPPEKAKAKQAGRSDYADTLDVGCPRCGAAPGSRCPTTDTRGRPALHPERAATARTLPPAPQVGKPKTTKNPPPSQATGATKAQRRALNQEQARRGEERRRRQALPPQATAANQKTIDRLRGTWQARQDRDDAYRDQLGVASGTALPKAIGVTGSAGAARGGRGASRKGRGTYG